MEKPEKPYIAHLDGLRGGAALWVLIAHCMIWAGWMPSWFPNPKIAVDIFMVISGYLMAHNWRPTTTARDFWIRRFFRIAPVYYLSLLTAAVLAPWVLGGYAVLYPYKHGPIGGVYDPARIRYTPANWLLHLTFLFGLVPRWSFSTMLPDWSISLEMQFYAVLPALILLIRRYGAAPLVVVTLIGSSLAHRWADFPEPSFLPLKFPVFLVGMLAADSTLSRSIGALVLSAFRADRLVTLTTGVLLYLASGAKSPLRDLLGSRMSAFLAEMSYAVYLFHGFFIAILGGYLFQQGWLLRLQGPARVALLTALVIPLTYMTAAVLHRWVELPGIAWGRRIANSGRQSSTSA